MTNKLEELYLEIYNKVNKQYLPFYNLYNYELFTQKCECFQKFGSDPIQYYKCFDTVEKIVVKDKKGIKEMKEDV